MASPESGCSYWIEEESISPGVSRGSRHRSRLSRLEHLFGGGGVNPILQLAAALAAVLLMQMTLATPNAAAQGTGISVSPPNFALEAQPGQVVSQEIVVSNHGGGELPIRIDAAGFEPAGSLGQATIINQQTDVVTWTLVSPKEFILKPGGRQTVTFLIDVPPDAPPGGHYLSILASLGIDGAGAGGVSVGQRVGVLILLRVAGEVKEDLHIASFTGPGFTARGPVTFDLLARNLGNVHLRPAGVITITSMFGGEVARLPVPEENILPGSERAFAVTWDAGWRIGWFTAEYLGIYGARNSEVRDRATVVIFPWYVVLPPLAVLTLVLFAGIRGRRRIRRSIAVLLGKE